jgi:hypothetical protein
MAPGGVEPPHADSKSVALYPLSFSVKEAGCQIRLTSSNATGARGRRVRRCYQGGKQAEHAPEIVYDPRE